ncbi:hypothetical protein ACFE04_026286 [Oxalis oulophora]
MALALGKLTILIGAGITGAILAKEQRMPNFSDVFSGAFKILTKLNTGDSTSSSASKPQNDSLLAQVNSLQEELKMLAASRPITIVTASGTGSSRYGLVIIVIVVGYGYYRWKGFKLPDMMFATQRGLGDACNDFARQLEGLYSSISATKLHLSKKLDNTDVRLEEGAVLNGGVEEDVSALQGRSGNFGEKVRVFHDAVQVLQTKINTIEGKQGDVIQGVAYLCYNAAEMERSMAEEQKQAELQKLAEKQKQALLSASSLPALELHPATTSRTGSMPAVLSLEPPPSPSYSTGSQQELSPISPEASSSRYSGLSSNSNSGLFALMGDSGATGTGGSFLTRTRSATNAFSHRQWGFKPVTSSQETVARDRSVALEWACSQVWSSARNNEIRAWNSGC